MSLRKGLAIFLMLTLGVGMFIVSRSVDRLAIEAFLNMKKIKLFHILLTVLVAWACDAARFCMTAKAMGYDIRFTRGVQLTWLHYFGCAITPMQVGGGPFQVYVLYKSGIPVGSGVAITLVRTLFSTFLLSIAAPAAFFFVPQLAEGGILVRGVFCYVGALSMVMWTLFILSIVKADWIKHSCNWALLLIKKIQPFKMLRVVRLARMINSEIDSYSKNIKRMLGPGMKYFLIAFFLSICQLVVIFSVLPQLMEAVDIRAEYFHVILCEAMFMFILYFIPTPGASGVAEGGGAAIFSLLMPTNMTGIMAVLWRFFTEYLAIFMGCIVAIRMIGWGTAEKIMSGAHDDEIMLDEKGVDDGKE